MSIAIGLISRYRMLDAADNNMARLCVWTVAAFVLGIFVCFAVLLWQ